MTPEAQNRAIAEAVGWTFIRAAYCWSVQQGRDVMGQRGHHPEFGVDEEIPDFCADLNAMATAEKAYFATKPPVTWAYSNQLEEVVRRDWDDGMPDLNFVCFYCATAPQRAESFLRTLNLWTPTGT